MQPLLIATTHHNHEWMLIENHPLLLVREQGTQIECQSGKAWITAFNVLEDIELRPGEVFVIPNRGLVLVEGAASCRIRVQRSGGVMRTVLKALRLVRPHASPELAPGP